MVKNRSLTWAEREDKRNAYRSLVEKPVGKCQVARQR